MTELASPPAADRPAHYRLKTETWEIILKEYVEGATAPFLAKKWRVSLHAIRKRISEHKATKRDWGDAQAVSQAQARQAELEAERRASPKAAAGRLFDGLGPVGGDAGDPEVLMRLATVASGRAMTGRLWAEAKALAGLAEAYGRLAARQEAAAPTIESLPLELLLEILHDDEHRAAKRFSMYDPERETPENRAIKSRYWGRRLPREKEWRDLHQQAYELKEMRKAQALAAEAAEAAIIAPAAVSRADTGHGGGRRRGPGLRTL